MAFLAFVKAASSAALIHFARHLLRMLCGVILCRLFRMVRSLYVVTMCDVGMMSRCFLVTACLVLGRFSVMAGCMLVVLRRFFVVFCALLAHLGFLEGLRFRETDEAEDNDDNRRLSNLQAR